MKKISLLLLCVCSSLFVFADGLTATLQHGETMTAYFGQSALDSAYQAAADGDVITLSPGQFSIESTIAKSVRIVGAYGLSNSATNATYIGSELTINANDVSLEGLSFKTAAILNAISNCTFKRCWISWLRQSGTHTNTLVSQCVLQVDDAIATGVNYGIKNTSIGRFAAMNTASNVANITNCYIEHFYESGTTNNYCQPYAVYKNNVIRLHKTNNGGISISFYSPSEFYYNYFYQTQSYSSRNSSYTAYVVPNYNAGCNNTGNNNSGQIYDASFSDKNISSYSVNGADDTSVGVQGGEGWQEYPGIPRIVSMSIDAQTNDQGQLNASINVEAVK